MERYEIENLAIAMWVAKLSGAERKVYINFLQSVSNPIELINNQDFFNEIKNNSLNKDVINSNCELLNQWFKLGIKCVALGCQDYPIKLSTIEDPPLILFYMGDISNVVGESRSTLAVIGSRRADLDMCKVAYDFSNQACACGLCIVSGLAYGVDASAHRGALATQQTGATVAVLGGGLKHIYPRVHIPLAKEIVDNGGAVISQFLPDESPFPVNFLNRNRVIAGLSDAVLVIQASERSGSLSTARFALEDGRDVLVCPGAYNDSRFAGSNQLIKQGAFLVSDINDVFDFFPEIQEECRGKIGDIIEDSKIVLVNKFEKKVWKLLSNGGLDREDLIMKLLEEFGQDSNIQTHLLEMELSGKILILPGDRIVRG